MPVSTRKQFRATLKPGAALILPGVANALAARVAADCGFTAAYVTGAGIANTFLGIPDNGLVTVRVRPRDDARVLIEVIDVGMGIGPEHHERIFERFYRVDKGRARSAGGTGLRLSIVKRLVVGMGGELELRSQPGRGSVFRVFLDAAT